MNNTKNKKKTFMAAMIMLLVSAIVITSASFAWFSLGKNAAVREIDINVTAKDGIEISANTSKFTTEITFANLNRTDETTGNDATSVYNAVEDNFNYFSNSVSPVSTDFSLDETTKLPVFFKGGITSSYESTTKDAKGDTKLADTSKAVKVEKVAESATAGFYAFDVYVNYINNEDDAAKATIVVGNSLIAAVTKDGVEKKENVANAFRIGFVNCGTVAKDSKLTSLNASAQKGTCIMGMEDVNSTNPLNEAKTYDLVDGTSIAKSTATYQSNICVGRGNLTTAQLTLDQGINRIRVYIWMEGQDSNCIDEMASQQLSIDLVFQQVDPTA